MYALWEYKVEFLSEYDSDTWEQLLNSHGNLGWELCSVDNRVAYFIRVKVNEGTLHGKRFQNVWEDKPGMTQRCIDCGEVVQGLQGVQNHTCKDKSNARTNTEDKAEGKDSNPIRGSD